MSSMFLSHLLLPPNLCTPAMLGLENSQADVAKSAPYLHNANRRIITCLRGSFRSKTWSLSHSSRNHTVVTNLPDWSWTLGKS